LNPSVAYRWEFAKHWRARAAAAQTLRAPKFENLTTAVASGSGTATTPYVSGNPDLRPERAKGFDVGVEHDFFGRTAFAALNYSQRFITDAVEKRTALEADGFYYNRPYNVPGTSRTRAIEIDTRFDLRPLGLRNVTVLANYSRFFSRKAGSTDPLGDQPHYVANTGMDWRAPALNTLFGWRYNYQGRIYKASGESESPQHLLDAFAYWDINRDWSLRVSGSNLLDTKKTKYKPTVNTSGALTGLTREQERSGRGLLLTLEARL
jgi:iron complex outermembrane receptor protein